MRIQHNRMASGSDQAGMRQFVVSHKHQLAEACWFSVALVLFLLLGPFAAPVVVLALFNLPAEERGASEPESFQEAVHFQLR